MYVAKFPKVAAIGALNKPVPHLLLFTLDFTCILIQTHTSTYAMQLSCFTDIYIKNIYKKILKKGPLPPKKAYKVVFYNCDVSVTVHATGVLFTLA